MNPFRLLPPLLLLLSSGASQAEASMFIKTGGIYCLERFQDELIEIIDAKSDREQKRAIGAAVFSGSCVGATPLPIAIANVLKKTTPAGYDYYCFTRLAADGYPRGERECSPMNSLALVADEKRRRTGDYEIVGEGVGAVKALCKEGGLVTIYKDEQWTRLSMVLPTKTPPDLKPISRDQNYEIREGCKGSDSDD